METIWLEIYGSEMMATTFAAFLELLNIHDMKYASYLVGDVIIFVEVKGKMTDEFNEKLSQFMYYQPIYQLDKEPHVSDIDLIAGMSNID